MPGGRKGDAAAAESQGKCPERTGLQGRKGGLQACTVKTMHKLAEKRPDKTLYTENAFLNPQKFIFVLILS